MIKAVDKGCEVHLIVDGENSVVSFVELEKMVRDRRLAVGVDESLPVFPDGDEAVPAPVPAVAPAVAVPVPVPVEDTLGDATSVTFVVD